MAETGDDADAIMETVMRPSRCRFCDADLSQTFADLGMSPLANSYVPQEGRRRAEPFYPLHAFVCSECRLVQLEAFETREAIFSQYLYFSSYSDTWLEHSERYADAMIERLRLGPRSKVVEVASNDGYLLQYFVKRDIPVLGVEPAANVAEAARAKGVPTEVVFFGKESAERLLKNGHAADLIAANNVLAHVPDIKDFVRGFKTLLKATGVLTVEFPHLLRQIAENQFDTIYHEHFCYLSFTVVEKMFADAGLTVFDVAELPTHGGSLRIFARHAVNDALPISDAAHAMRRREEDAGLLTDAPYRKFAEQVVTIKCALLEFLIDARRRNQRVAAYGAPAKGNTLLNYCGIKNDLIDFTVDRSPHKQGLLLPGTHIDILAPEAIMERRPDYVLILPWNLRDEISMQMAAIRGWGGRFVVPIPKLEVF